MDDARNAGPFSGYAPGQEESLRGHVVLMGAFLSICGTFAAWLRRSGRRLPERFGAGDLVVLSVATHKAARLVAKDRVTSPLRAPFTRFEHDDGPGEVAESPRGSGLRRAIGELVSCPYCLGVWIASGFIFGLIAAPRATRAIASMLTVVSGASVLQIAYKKAEDAL
ncbi:MAG TPA: DUF1360 domain-containing protein [Solirubrobacteraceae bacterium]|jgi:hypothetical protein|nr:DUF1360 domain-containing protein [Solirubrobacteraceae bacterium]